MRAWLNGRLLEDPTAPAVTLRDHGLTVGDGAFEAVKVVDGRPFALTRHLDRLARSAAGLGLPAGGDAGGSRGGGAGLGGRGPLPRGRSVTHTRGGAPPGSAPGHRSP